MPTRKLSLALSACLGIFATTASAEAIRTTLLAGGCFWCVEADFESVDGVREVVSGFAGGTVANPSYKQVTKGGTGHYEVVQITYDADIVSYSQLLNLFFRSVDPTDAGGQFCDRGQSYATAIFAATDEEERLARRARASAAAKLSEPIATKILPDAPFYAADAYHQNYYRSDDRVLTRFGWIPKHDAYKRYRKGCGRDKRVRELWGNAAPFAG